VLVLRRHLSVRCNTHKPSARCQIILLSERPKEILCLELVRHADTGIFDLVSLVSKSVFHLGEQITHY
jgi:hypothetical protein